MQGINDISLLAKDPGEDVSGEQYLSFVINGEQYGLRILLVQEIRAWEPVTRIPNSPAHVKGVLNLRGNIVPVYDMRLKFGLSQAIYCKETVVIVMRVVNSGNERSIGFVTDAVSDVIVVDDDSILETPEFGPGIPTEFITGIVPDGNNMVMLLDIDRLSQQEPKDKGQSAA